jgi:ABC-type dipeptide/oligopeptide/nickel transport system permease component
MHITNIWQKVTLTAIRIRVASAIFALLPCITIIIFYSLESNIIDYYISLMNSMPSFMFAVAGFLFGFRGNILDGVSKKNESNSKVIV